MQLSLSTRHCCLALLGCCLAAVGLLSCILHDSRCSTPDFLPMTQPAKHITLSGNQPTTHSSGSLTCRIDAAVPLLTDSSGAFATAEAE